MLVLPLDITTIKVPSPDLQNAHCQEMALPILSAITLKELGWSVPSQALGPTVLLSKSTIVTVMCFLPKA